MRHRITSAALVLVCLATGSGSGHAQWTAPALDPRLLPGGDPGPERAMVAPVPEALALAARPERASTGALLMGGITLGALGLVAGGRLGAYVDPGASEYFPISPVGAVVGEAVLLPLGVHLANGRKGRYWASLLPSVGAAALGLGLAQPTYGLSLLIVPVVQLSASIRAERATSQDVLRRSDGRDTRWP